MRQQNITTRVRFFITKCEFYYKLRQLLQNALILLQNVSFITKRGGTYTEFVCKVYTLCLRQF